MPLATPKALALPPNWSNESYKITPKEKPDEETKFLKSNRIVDLKKDQKNQGPNVSICGCLGILFLSNCNIHKSSCGLCFWASDPINDRFY